MRPLIKGYIEQWDWLIPRWVQTLNVLWEAQNEDERVAHINVNPDYRWATMVIYSCWAGEPESKRINYLLHELLHIPSMGLYREARDIAVASTKDNVELREVLLENLRQRYEAMTQDLTDRLLVKEKRIDTWKRYDMPEGMPFKTAGSVIPPGPAIVMDAQEGKTPNDLYQQSIREAQMEAQIVELNYQLAQLARKPRARRKRTTAKKK